MERKGKKRPPWKDGPNKVEENMKLKGIRN
jgi:hypothetical protein